MKYKRWSLEWWAYKVGYYVIQAVVWSVIAAAVGVCVWAWSL